MNTVLFNFHDLILLMTALQCLFFATLLLGTNPNHQISQYFLAAFLLAHAIIPFNELILWGEVFKFKAQASFPNAYLLSGTTYYIDTALVYLYLKSLVFKDYKPSPKALLHLIPVAIFILYSFVVFYSKPIAERIALISQDTLVYRADYLSLDFACKLLRMVYGLLCIKLVFEYKNSLKSQHSNIEAVSLDWLKIFIFGFVTVISMDFIVVASKLISLTLSFDVRRLPYLTFMGLTSYYIMFALINILVFTSSRYFAKFKTVTKLEKQKESLKETWLEPDLSSRIDHAVKTNKLYLQTDLSLATLADSLNIPPKDLSTAINRLFDLNFYEFINRYRIEAAKDMLSSNEHKDKSISEIYTCVGFNSKSVFNTFFKKIVGETPSAFRKKNL